MSQNRSYRVNERIRAPKVRVIDDKGNQLGIMDIAQARTVAEEAGLDLIEVAPDGDPPVCRLLDWGRFRYEQKKKVKDAQRRTKQTEIKNLRVRPNTSTHDIEFKTRNAIKFLKKGHKVTFTVIFRGPELRHKDIGRDQLLKIAEGAKGYGEIETPPHMEGRRMLMMLAPVAGAADRDADSAQETPETAESAGSDEQQDRSQS